jgi:hypothetical protein
VVRDLVRDAAEQVALRAGHPLVAHHDEIGVLVLGDLDECGGGVALASMRLSLHSAGAHADERLCEDRLDVHVGEICQSALSGPPPWSLSPESASYALTRCRRAPVLRARSAARLTASVAVLEPSVPTTIDRNMGGREPNHNP